MPGPIVYLYRKFRGDPNKDAKKQHRHQSSNPANALQDSDATVPVDADNNAITSVNTTVPLAESEAQIEERRAEKAAKRKYRWKILVALLLPNFVASLDLTIIATAAPTISSYFSACFFILIITNSSR
jgi:hypothetical protein